MKKGDEVVQELPWKWRVHGKIFLIGGLGYMFDAWDVILNGFLAPLIASDWGISGSALGWIGTANLIGMAVGAIVWGTIADVIGRKRAFTLTLLMFAICSGLGALSPNFFVFCLFRFLAGVGLGGCIPVDYALVSEFMPIKQRGKFLSLMNIWWPIGATLCGITATLLLPLENWLVIESWRVLLLIMVAPALLVVWVRRDIPESPIFLQRRGRHEEARAVITGLAAKVGVDLPEWELAESRPREKMSLKAISDQLFRLWRYSVPITLTMWSLFLTVFLVYYGAIIWLPQILASQGYANFAAFMVTTLMTAVGVVGVMLSAWLVSLVGRKWVIGVSGPLAAASLVLFAIQIDSEFAAKLWIVLFGFFIELTIPALYAYVSEVYPTHLRASGFGWASTVSRTGAGFGPVILGALMWPFLGLPNTFAVIGALLAAAVLLMAFFAPETRGRALDAV